MQKTHSVASKSSKSLHSFIKKKKVKIGDSIAVETISQGDTKVYKVVPKKDEHGKPVMNKHGNLKKDFKEEEELEGGKKRKTTKKSTKKSRKTKKNKTTKKAVKKMFYFF